MKVFTIANDKGGVAKTTTAINMSSGLARKGKRVLAVDLDSQANCTSVLVGHKQATPTIYDLLKDNRRHSLNVTDVIAKTTEEGVDIIPSNHQMKSAEIEFSQLVNNQQLLLKRLAEVEALGIYDYVIIDTPPNATLIKLIGLFCADTVIVPVVPSDFSLEGIEELIDDLSLVSDARNSAIDIGFLLCRTDHTNMTKYIRQELRETFNEFVFKTEIPNNTTIRDAQRAKKSILTYNPHASGAVAYYAFVEEVLHHD